MYENEPMQGNEPNPGMKYRPGGSSQQAKIADYGPGGPQLQRPSEVRNEVENLSSNLDDLNHVLTELESRLAPVLRTAHELPEEASVSDAVLGPVLSPLAGELHGHGWATAHCVERVRSLLERLEL